MTQTGVLAGANGVLDAGVRSVAGFEELGVGGGGVGGQKVGAPAVGVFEQRQLRAGVGPFAAADDAHVLGPRGQLVTVGSVAQQVGELNDPGLVELAGLALGVEDGAPGGCGYAEDGLAFPGGQLPADGVVHRAPRRGVEPGDVLDQAGGSAGTLHRDQQVAAVGGRDLGDCLVQPSM